MMLPAAVRDYLVLDETLVDMLPEQSGLADATTSPQKKAASVYLRRADQNAVHPFILVGMEHDRDEGHTCDGPSTRKISRFCVYVSGDVSAAQLESIEKRVRYVLIGVENEPASGVRQKYLPSDTTEGKVWVQSLMILGRQFQDAQNSDGGEEGLPSWVLEIHAAYDET